MAASRSRYTNPIENLRSYIMIKAGVQKDERLADLEWIEDKIKAANEIVNEVSKIEGIVQRDSASTYSGLRAAVRRWKDLG